MEENTWYRVFLAFFGNVFALLLVFRKESSKSRCKIKQAMLKAFIIFRMLKDNLDARTI